MAKLSAQDCFNIACNYYTEARGIVEELSNFAKRVNSNFSFDIAMRQYDQILQAVLISAAVADGRYMQIESDFINKITDYGDVLIGFNASMKKQNSDWVDFTWDDIDDFSNGTNDDTRTKLVAIILTYTEELSDDFVKWFAPIDGATGKEFLEALVEKTNGIIISFTAVDGDEISTESDSAKEFGMASRMLNLALVEKWEKARDEFNNR